MHRIAWTLLLLAAIVGRADAASNAWSDAYLRGTTAAQAGDWQTVKVQMDAAIAEQPAEKLGVTAGRKRLAEYTPHFWLGLAKFKLGDVDGAMRSWDVSQGQGVIQRTQSYATLQAYRSQARQRLEQEKKESRSGIRKDAEASINKARQSKAKAMGSASRLDSYKSASVRLDQAIQRAKNGETDPKAYPDAAAIAAEADAGFIAALKEAESRKAARAVPAPVQRRTAPPPPAPAQVAVASPPAEAKVEVVAPKEGPSETLVNTRKRLERLEKQIATAARSKSTVEPQLSRLLESASESAVRWKDALTDEIPDRDAAEIEGEIAGLEERVNDQLRQIAAKEREKKALAIAEAQFDIKAELLGAYRAYAAGRMSEAETLLTRIIDESGNSSEAYLLRGCVLFTRAATEGDRSLLPAAERDFTSAVRINPRASLDARYFSPKLVAAVKDARARRK